MYYWPRKQLIYSWGLSNNVVVLGGGKQQVIRKYYIYFAPSEDASMWYVLFHLPDLYKRTINLPFYTYINWKSHFVRKRYYFWEIVRINSLCILTMSKLPNHFALSKCINIGSDFMVNFFWMTEITLFTIHSSFYGNNTSSLFKVIMHDNH